MKKLLTALLTLVLVVLTAFSLSACSDNKFEGTSMKNWGAIQKTGGGITITDNYIYYVNGIGSSSDDNTFGVPVKGALMVADKSDLSKTEIVVPKLFTSRDYSAGYYVYGSGAETYVYYATPCTEKNSAGSIAKDQMTFMRTRLDGEKSETYLTLSSLDVEYRIVENAGKVYIVYYDSTESALKCYDTTNKQTTVIVKTESDVAGKYTSLNTYKFVDNGSLGQATLVYTVDVFSEDYNASKAEKEDYQRPYENYNKVFAYKAGDAIASGNETAGTLVLDGTNGEYTFAVTYVNGSDVYFTQTDIYANEKGFTCKIDELADASKRVELANVSLATSANLIVAVDEVYSINEDGTAIIKKSMLNKGTALDEKVAICSASSILFIDNGYIYYINTETELMRTKLLDEDSVAELVTTGTVATSWFAPELIEIGGETYLFYCDTTTVGSSYMGYINLDKATLVSEDSDEDGKNDTFYLEGNKQFGKILEKDKANLFVDAMNKINAKGLDLTEENGVYSFAPAVEARALYNSLSEEAQKAVGEAYLEKLDKIEKAIELCNLYTGLKEIDGYNFKTDDEKKAIKSAYETAKAYRISIIEEKSSAYLIDIRDNYIPGDINYYFATAQKVFGDRD